MPANTDTDDPDVHDVICCGTLFSCKTEELKFIFAKGKI